MKKAKKKGVKVSNPPRYLFAFELLPNADRGRLLRGRVRVFRRVHQTIQRHLYKGKQNQKQKEKKKRKKT
jgi:hypothetical protein